jgi:hypothetical protein
VGLGFVLFAWLLIFGCIGLPVAGGLATCSWLWGRKRGKPSRWRAVAAAALPFVLIAVGLGWFFAYAAYSWSVRRVDPALGDSSAVPLKHNYFFCMIDVPDDGYLMKGECSGSPPVAKITEIAEAGDAIVGVSREIGPFVFDLRSGEVARFSTVAEAASKVSPAPVLKSADAFYRERRFGWQDLVAVALLGTAVVGVSALWLLRFVRPPSPRPD